MSILLITLSKIFAIFFLFSGCVNNLYQDEQNLGTLEQHSVDKPELSAADPEPSLADPEPTTADPELPSLADPELPSDSTDSAVLLRSYELLSTMLNHDELEGAIEMLETGVDIPPEDAEILLIQLYLSTGDLDNARIMIDSVLSREQHNIQALYGQTELAFMEDDMVQAVTSLEHILMIDSNDTRALNFLGELSLLEGRYEEAREIFRHSLAIEESFIASLGLANTYMRTQNAKSALTILDDLVGIEPDSYIVYADRGMANVLLHNFKEADQDFTDAIALNPDYAWNYLDRARVRLEQRRFLEAERDLTQFVMLEPDVFIGYHVRGQLYDRIRKFGQAKEDYKLAIALRNDFYPAMLPLAILCYISNEFAYAGELFASYYKHTDRIYPEYALLAALAMMENNKEQQAQEYLNSILPYVEQRGIFYTLIQFFLGEEREAHVKRLISKISNKSLRYRLEFYLGVYYDLQGYTETATVIYRNIEEHGMQGFVETKLATWKYRTATGDSPW